MMAYGTAGKNILSQLIIKFQSYYSRFHTCSGICKYNSVIREYGSTKKKQQFVVTGATL
jgi:hypothetical protein